jgi:hypothetical protein
MSIQKKLLENALNRATKEAEKLKLDDLPRPQNDVEEHRHQIMLELINKKKQQVQQVRSYFWQTVVLYTTHRAKRGNVYSFKSE